MKKYTSIFDVNVCDTQNPCIVVITFFFLVPRSLYGGVDDTELEGCFLLGSSEQLFLRDLRGKTCEVKDD